jgi:hypothetical protein
VRHASVGSSQRDPPAGMLAVVKRTGASDRLWSGVCVRLALAGTAVVLACVSLSVGASAALAADAAPVFTADTPPPFQLDVFYVPASNCGSGCSSNDQIGYAFAASGSPVPTYSVSSGALPIGVYLDPATGLLYGLPSSPGQSYSFSVSASNGVAPDAVAGPFSGTLGPACAGGGSSTGLSTTTTTSTRLVATNPVDLTLPDASAQVTEVVGRVIQNGAATVVYDEQAPVAVSDPQAQALLAAASKADTDAAPGSSVAAPSLASTMTTTSPPSQVAQTIVSAGTVTADTTVNIGPVTLHIGDYQSCMFVVSPGSEDVDTLVSSSYDLTDEEQSTDTTTSVYHVDATASAPIVPPSSGTNSPPPSGITAPPPSGTASPPPSGTTSPPPTGTTPSPMGTIVSPPVDRVLPVSLGIGKAGGKLSCSPGSWTNDPTLFAYQWSFDGTPIQGATGDTYTVRIGDEGLTLACTVIASNAAGSGNPATSKGMAVVVPEVAGCPGATGSLSGMTLGLVRLGMTRGQARGAYTQSSTRGRKYEDFFCLTPIGVRVGYGSPALIHGLARHEREQLADRVVWASTSSAHYSLAGVRVGATIAAAGKTLTLTGPIPIGLNDWYFAPNGSSTAILKVRHGIIEEIGICDKPLTSSHETQLNFLKSFT